MLEDNQINYVPYDQPLHIAKNPEYLKEQALYELTKQVGQFIKKDPSRLIEIAAMLNYQIIWKFKKIA